VGFVFHAGESSLLEFPGLKNKNTQKDASLGQAHLLGSAELISFE
jgi:hypothetical protein